MKYTHIAASLMACAMPVGITVAQDAKQMDAKKLCDMAPRITLENKEIESFEVSGAADFGEVRLAFSLMGKQPDQLQMMVMDAADRTPVMLAMGNRAMIYDPLKAMVLLADAGPNFEFRMVNDAGVVDKQGDPEHNMVFAFGVKPLDKDAKEGGQAVIIIDIPSLMEVVKERIEIKHENKEGERYLITGTSKNGNVIKAVVDPSRKSGPYTRLEMISKGEDSPFLVLDKIAINQPIQDQRFVFPEQQLKQSDIPTEVLRGKGLVGEALSVRRSMLVIMARLVLMGQDDPRLKASVEKMTLGKIDWEQVKENDVKHSAALKKLFLDVE